MGRHPSHRIRENSRASYHSEDWGPRVRAVLGVYERKRAALRDREVMEALGFRDMNTVRPRITELVDAGVLVEIGSEICPVTEKMVRLVILKPRKPVQLELFPYAQDSTAPGSVSMRCKPRGKRSRAAGNE